MEVTNEKPTSCSWREAIEKKVHEALKNDLLTWAKVNWVEPEDGIGPPDLDVRSAYLRPPENENVHDSLRRISDDYFMTVRWEYFQDEDKCGDDGYPWYWDNAVTFSPF